jgi:hypothetical protein
VDVKVECIAEEQQENSDILLLTFAYNPNVLRVAGFRPYTIAKKLEQAVRDEVKRRQLTMLSFNATKTSGRIFVQCKGAVNTCQ